MAGCTTYNPPAFRLASFQDERIAGKSILFLPWADLHMQNRVTFQAHYRKDLRAITAPDPERILAYRLMCRSLRKHVENGSLRCDESLDLNAEDIRDTALRISLGVNLELQEISVVDTFFIPNASVIPPENPPDYVLLVAKPSLATWLVHPKQEEMRFTGSYVLLDHRKGTVVGYGYLRASGSYSVSSFSGTSVGRMAPESRRYRMSRNLWPYVFDWAAVQIIAETPFAGEKVRKRLNDLMGIW